MLAGSRRSVQLNTVWPPTVQTEARQMHARRGPETGRVQPAAHRRHPDPRRTDNRVHHRGVPGHAPAVATGPSDQQVPRQRHPAGESEQVTAQTPVHRPRTRQRR